MTPASSGNDRHEVAEANAVGPSVRLTACALDDEREESLDVALRATLESA